MLVNNEYIYILIFIVTGIGFAILLILISRYLMRQAYGRAHYVPYECGVESFGDARRQIGISFYNYGLSFILSDIEVLFILPAVPSFMFMSSAGRVFFYLFVWTMIIGYRYEIKNNFLTLRS